jgi:hypothetical protein
MSLTKQITLPYTTWLQWIFTEISAYQHEMQVSRPPYLKPPSKLSLTLLELQGRQQIQANFPFPFFLPFYFAETQKRIVCFGWLATHGVDQ